MTTPKMTMALASLLLSGAFAITPYLVNSSPADCQTTVTVEPQQIGSTTSNGIIMYSVNYCTVVESTQCQVSLTSATDVVLPESSAGYSAPVIASTTQAASVTSAVGGAIVPGEPVPTTVVTEIAPGAPQPTGQTAATVALTTESLGNPTLKTTGTLSASGSVTGKQQINSTSIFTHDSPSSSVTAPSAPDRTNAGAILKALPGTAFGIGAMAMAYFV